MIGTDAINEANTRHVAAWITNDASFVAAAQNAARKDENGASLRAYLEGLLFHSAAVRLSSDDRHTLRCVRHDLADWCEDDRTARCAFDSLDFQAIRRDVLAVEL